MLPDFFRNSDLWGLLLAGSIFFGLLVAALIVRFVFEYAISHRKSRRSESLTANILKTVEGPVVVFIALSGGFLGFLTLTTMTTPTFRFLAAWGDEAQKIWQVIIVIEVTYLIAHLATSLIGWYRHEVAVNTESEVDDKLIRPLGRVVPAAIYALGLLIALDTAGISISPLLAGLGIAGLAVALALQPTLSNFFAGTYIVTEAQLKEGDYIELESGPAGYIENIGWRSTKLRSMFDNLVIIPNSRMAESIMWNYYGPAPTMYVLVSGGVSYDSDLGRVEEIVMDVCRNIAASSDSATKDVEPFFGYDKFDESNVNFWIFMQATDRFGSFILTSEIIKGVHARFKEEGITINYPMRNVMLRDSDGLPQIPNAPWPTP